MLTPTAMLAPRSPSIRVGQASALHVVASQVPGAQSYYGLLLAGRIAFRALERVHADLRATGVLLSADQAIRLSANERALLADLYAGKRTKEIAVDRGRNPTMVCTAIKVALAKQGLTTREGAVWVARSLSLGHADASPGWDPEYGLCISVQVHATLATAAFRRLSLAERAVVCRMIDGASQQTIAQERNTSVRTVANQLATAFRKVATSDRLEVVRRLVGPCPELAGVDAE